MTSIAITQVHAKRLKKGLPVAVVLSKQRINYKYWGKRIDCIARRVNIQLHHNFQAGIA